jgi:hypothetical protein
VPNTQSGELGLLMMYRRNAGREAGHRALALNQAIRTD